MNDFKNERDEQNSQWSLEEFCENRRKKIMEIIKPICEIFSIHDYDYEIRYSPAPEGKYVLETLIIEGQKIACTSSSIGEIVMELIGYIYINLYEKYNPFGVASNKTIKRWWLGNEE